jgi:UPF0716 protein FxsA
MVQLFALFILLPALELALLIEIGSRIGTGATLALIVVTGMLGASLARHQGLRVIGTVQRELAEGRLPAASLLDGLMILLASALMITPGVLTDVFGFLCLVPAFRSSVKAHLRHRFEKAVTEQRIHVHVDGIGLDPNEFNGASPFRDAPPASGPIIDVTPEPPTPGDDPARRSPH